MPNHFHGIIIFTDTPRSKFSNKESNLSKIIKYFKSKTTIQIKNVAVGENLDSPGIDAPDVNNLNVETHNSTFQTGDLKIAPTNGTINHHKIWQKSFFDHVIRDEKDLQRIREYIYNNPTNWELDSLNPKTSS